MQNGGVLPMFTSCSPAWVNYVETHRPDLIPHLSTCKSPQQMAGALIREVYPRHADLAGKRLVVVSVMPCTAKKSEAQELSDVDYVLTTRELEHLWGRFGIEFGRFTEQAPLDAPFAEATGAGRLFAGSGGVMEAAVRTAAMMAAGQELEGGPKVAEARGAEGVRRFTVTAGDAQLNLAVVNGLGRVKEAVDALLRPARPRVHFVEVMSCPGGCVGGGGQPYDTDAAGGQGAAGAPLRSGQALPHAPLSRERGRAGALRGAPRPSAGRGLPPPAAPHLHRPQPAQRPRSEGDAMSGTIITTIKQNCRRCYTCVRDCPAEAIRIEDGQAFVVDERCIACGNCTLVCSQNAKAYLSGLERASWLLDEDAPVAALLAPSFPAGFSAPAGQVVGAFKAAGFDYVVEVAQGADLVSRAYADYLEANPTGVHIATACPAVAEYVRKYHPEMVDRLVPIVSPMVATALAVKELYGDDVRCVFVGPCVAKKAEARDPQLEPVIDEVLTLQEAHRLLAARGVDPAKAAAAAWDEPAAGRARVFPLPGGLLESAGMDRGMLDPDVLVVSGHDETIEVLDSLSEADTGQTLLVEALMCRGCYCGPGISSSEPGLLRKRRVGEYVAECRRREAQAEQAEDDRLAAAFPGLKLEPELHSRRPAAPRAHRGGHPRDPGADQQVLPRGRAQLRRLRLPDLPRQGRRRPLRHGRGRHVPALHDRPGRARLRRAQRARGARCATSTATSSTRRSWPPWARWPRAWRTSSTTR